MVSGLGRTTDSSARFKDFEPQWDKTEVELLPNNEKMLIVPVVRFLSVGYNQSIGFIRRLCIRVDANEDFLEANIVELVGNLTFVKANHSAIFKNYKENTLIGGFEGTIIVYQLDYDVETAKFYSGGVFQRNTTMQTQRVSTCIVIGSTYISGWSCGNANDPWHATATNCQECTSGYWQSSYSFIECFVSGGGGNSSGNTGVSSGPSGSTPNGGGSSGSNTPYVPPIKDTGISWEEEDNIEVEADIEENTLDPRTPREKVIFDPSLNDYPKLKCVLEAMIGTNNTDGNPTLKKMLNNVPLGERITIKTAPTPESTHLAIYKHADRSITFNSSMLARTSNIEFALVIVHESTHGFIHNEIAIAFPTNTIASFQSGGQSYTSSNAVLQDRIREYHAYYTTHAGGNFNSSSVAHHNIMIKMFLQDFTKATMEYSGTAYQYQLSAPFRALAMVSGLGRTTDYRNLDKAAKNKLKVDALFIIDKTTRTPKAGSMSERCR